ncbi:DUF3800 domain-containing protein [Nocardia rosealba]|uniref:DUF3800 domain-containing protein n=1 Tax=Nocardia rosealba TaxID=2878563 RepID=UPI001CD94E77|nr:DUF3800 domain-containing protein [Nocardia rosealba]MCA2209571.1 DUF3800 domain-containing protein [Nocardia rosealba]
MLLAFLDESYDKGEYWIAAVVCPSAEILGLAARLDAVVMKATGTWGTSERAELHGNDLVQGKHDWAPIARQVRARIGVYRDALRATADTRGLLVMLQGVDRQALEARYEVPWHPHRVVLERLLERLNDEAVRQGLPILVIADEVDGHDGHRKSLWEYQHIGTGGIDGRMLTNVADTIHFAPSCDSRLLQAADLVSYMHYRMRRTQVSDERAKKANEMLWSVIEPNVCSVHIWKP